MQGGVTDGGAEMDWGRNRLSVCHALHCRTWRHVCTISTNNKSCFQRNGSCARTQSDGITFFAISFFPNFELFSINIHFMQQTLKPFLEKKV